MFSHRTLSLPLALLLALVALTGGCAKQVRPASEREAEARRLYERANDMVGRIEEGEYSYAYINFHYQQAMKNIDRILVEYPDTEYGQKVKAGELKLGPYTIDHFRTALLGQLGDMKEATESVVNCAIYLYNLPEADPAQSHIALSQILETLCRLVRTDEAMIFPTLPEDQLYAQQTIVRTIAQYSQHDQAESILEGADPGQQPALAEAYGDGLAVGGAKLTDLQELSDKYPTPDHQVELGILRGMVERETIGYRRQFDKVTHQREKEAREALAKTGRAPAGPEEEAVRYDVAAYFREKFGAHPPAAAASLYAGLLALEGRFDEARALVAGLGEPALVNVIQSHYEHLSLAGGLTGREDLGRDLGLDADGRARCQLKLVEVLSENARYPEADAVEKAGMEAYPKYHDQFIRSRMRGVFYSREELFYLNSKTIPTLQIRDPAVCAEVLLDWFLSPNRLQKGSSWGADAIIFKYFSMGKEGRAPTHTDNKVD